MLEYTEIWPNLIRAARRAGARIALTNGRFAPEKVPQYRALFRTIGNPLRSVDLFLMRSDEEAERALALGAAPDRVWVTGNTKFDALLRELEPARAEALRRELGLPRRAPVFMAGSTHDGEEELLLRTLPGAARPLARPPARHRAPLRGAVRAGWRRWRPRPGSPRGCAAPGRRRRGRRSRCSTPSASSPPPTGWPRWSSWAAASCAGAGRTCSSRPGRGRPVLFGPHMENFKDSVPILVGRGAIQVATPEQLLRVAQELLARPDQMAELGALAREAVSQVRGASSRNVDHMLRLLPRVPPAEGVPADPGSRRVGAP